MLLMQPSTLKDFGIGKTVTANLNLTVNDAGDYSVNSTATAFASITSATAMVSATGHDKVYDGNNVATVDLNVIGAVGTDVLTAVDTAIFDGVNVGPHTVNVSGVTVSGKNALDQDVTANDYIYDTSTTTTANITAQALTAKITVDNKTYDGTNTATITGCTPVGNVSGDSVSCNATNGTFSDKNVGTKIVTAGVSFTGALGNYSATTSATATANITALGLTGSIIADKKVYDGTTVASTTCVLPGVISGDVVNCGTSNSVFNTKNAGSDTVNADLTLSGKDAGNYTVNPTAEIGATISQKPITVTAQPNTKVYDGNTSAAAIPTNSGVATGDTAKFIETYDNAEVGTGKTLTATGTTTDGNNGNNYAYSFETNTAGVITIANQTITFVTYPSGTIDGNSFVVTATSTSGLPVTFAGGASNICAVEASGTVNVTGSGQCPVIATQGSNIDYSSAPNVTMTFSVKYTVAPTLLASTNITSNSSSIGDLEGATLTTTGTTTGTNFCNGSNSGNFRLLHTRCF